MSNSLDEAKKRLANAQAERLEQKIAHQKSHDHQRVYHFPSPIVNETIDPAIEVITHWLDISDEPITLAINSGGGGVFAGFALYDFVAEHVAAGREINTTSYGCAASMAAVLLQAGKNRSMRPNAYFMVHEVQTLLHGSMANLKDHLDLIQEMQNRIEKIFVMRSTKITQEEIHEMTTYKDKWFNAEQALELGFIDFITEG